MRREYFGCVGCGRMFDTSEYESEYIEYGAHTCEKPDVRLFVTNEPRSIYTYLKGLFRR